MQPELNQQQKKRIQKVGLFAENKDLANFDVMQEIADSLEKLCRFKWKKTQVLLKSVC